MKYAVVDIGSNSVRLMVWADGKTLYKRVKTTRLGEGLALSPHLREGAMERTAQAVAEFCAEGRALGAECRAFATAAVRTAMNGGDFCARVKALCGVAADVVSGDEEALLGLSGALGERDGGIVDIGGASTEVCVRRGGELSFRVSLPVGAVRLFDLCGEDRALLSGEIFPLVSGLPSLKGEKIYAVGGTASTLASVLLGLEEYDASRLQDFRMGAKEVSALAERLLPLSLEERKKIGGMDPARADIIAGGALLLAAIMQKTELSEVFFSDRDNLEGYLYRKVLS